MCQCICVCVCVCICVCVCFCVCLCVCVCLFVCPCLCLHADVLWLQWVLLCYRLIVTKISFDTCWYCYVSGRERLRPQWTHGHRLAIGTAGCQWGGVSKEIISRRGFTAFKELDQRLLMSIVVTVCWVMGEKCTWKKKTWNHEFFFSGKILIVYVFLLTVANKELINWL